MRCTPEAVHAYWFGAPPLAPRPELWWRAGERLDAEVRQRFGEAVDAAIDGELGPWEADFRGSLALVLLLDQLSRHVHRGRARAFAGDARALEVARSALERGADRTLAPLETSFLVMPFEHAESRLCQRLAVALFEDLLARAPGTHQRALEGNLRFARQHREIIERFGRFPHRNEVLGRESTAAERAWLAEGGARFGQ